MTSVSVTRRLLADAARGQPVDARVHREPLPGDLDLPRRSRRRRRTGAGRRRARRAGGRSRPGASAGRGQRGSASHAVCAEPSIAANGAMLGELGDLRRGGRLHEPHAAVARDRLVVGAAVERVEDQAVGADVLRRRQHGPDVLLQRPGDERLPAVGVGDHDIAPAARPAGAAPPRSGRRRTAAARSAAARRTRPAPRARRPSRRRRSGWRAGSTRTMPRARGRS